MNKRKNHPPTWLEIQREHLLNALDDFIFLQNIRTNIGFEQVMGFVYLLCVAVFLALTVTAFIAG